MIRTLFPLVAAAIGLTAASLSAAPHGDRRPNILFIAVDDLRNDLGCYGVDAVKSPHIDRLARTGVVFDRAYCQVAVCNPSRVSVMTGLRPDTVRVWNLATNFREMTPDALTLPHHLRRHGYYAVGIGKVYHNPWQDPQSWSEPHLWPTGTVERYGPEVPEQIRAAQAKMTDDDWRKHDLRGPATYAPDCDDAQTLDGATARLAIDKLDELRRRDEPFFLAVGFIRPHLPFVAPKRYYDLYDLDRITPAPNPFVPRGAPPVAVGTSYEMTHYVDLVDFPKPTDPTVDDVTARRLIHGYRASVSFVDAQIGVLIDGLAERGLDDDTIVILWSDHGWKLGEHNAWGKMTNYELDTRVPLIVRAPRAGANGKRSRALVELTDLFPTVCELAGIPVPDAVEGQSLRPLLETPEGTLHDAAFSQYERSHDGTAYMGYAMRTDRYRYVEWRERKTGKVLATELYDHRTDPAENTNIAGNADADLVARLADRLKAFAPPVPVNDRPAVASRRSDEPARLTVHNATGSPIDLYWITPTGHRRAPTRLAPDQKTTIRTFIGHVFVAESRDGQTNQIVRVNAPDSRTVFDVSAVPE